MGEKVRASYGGRGRSIAGCIGNVSPLFGGGKKNSSLYREGGKVLSQTKDTYPGKRGLPRPTRGRGGEGSPSSRARLIPFHMGTDYVPQGRKEKERHYSV